MKFLVIKIIFPNLKVIILENGINLHFAIKIKIIIEILRVTKVKICQI